ncbi:MAG: hydroxysqualene dehydroxylase HpnE [Rhodospirillales bacterium]|nr:hydroxysqualene dehydroxylase HpnE [Rhodospirillales bacterium]MDE0379588.1 hydroxysqualene dehydroxylase HpnE [Rhodospirillales bacterium]
MATVHVIGAGMAGLSCAVELVKARQRVVLWEAAAQAGGRCRSFHDATLDRTIDNGNHLILGANPAVFAYLETVGTQGGLLGQARAAFPFVDLRTGERWTVRPNAGPVPWWIMAPSRRVPGSRARHYLAGLALARARERDTAAERLGGTGPLLERLWEPLTVAVLNASIDEASASLLWPVVRLTFGRGEAACRAYLTREGLGPNLVAPGVSYVEQGGGRLHYNRRLRAIAHDGRTVTGLDFAGDGDDEAFAPGDVAVLAVTPQVCTQLLPGTPAPLETRPIVNAHFRLDRPVPMPGGGAILGVVGGTAQWIFARGDIASVTVSAAGALTERPAAEIAALIWSDVSRALDHRPAAMPAVRIVKEKRATFAQVPSALPLRPPAETRLRNLFLAGDWTATGLPATIEGAIRSGVTAARHALAAV